MARWTLLAVLVGCGHPAQPPLGHSAAAPPAGPGTLATSIDQPHGLAVDPTGVYFSNARRLVRLGDSHVYPVDHQLEELAVVGGTLYGVADDSIILAVTLATGQLREVAEANGFVSSLAADRRGPVWGVSTPNDPHGGSLMAAPGGGQAVSLVTGMRFAEAIALDGDTAFWISGEGVFRIARDGGKVARLLEAPKHTGRNFLRVQGGKVYVATQDGLVAVDERGSTPKQLVPERADAWPDQFVVDESGVYFVDMDNTRPTRIRRVRLTGGAIDDLVDDAGDVAALTTDATYLYWLNARDRTLVRRPK